MPDDHESGHADRGGGRFLAELALPWVDAATGSLGQGLPYRAGIALAGRRLDKLAYQVRALCEDSEVAEGPMQEALDKLGTSPRSSM